MRASSTRIDQRQVYHNKDTQGTQHVNFSETLTINYPPTDTSSPTASRHNQTSAFQQPQTSRLTQPQQIEALSVDAQPFTPNLDCIHPARQSYSCRSNDSFALRDVGIIVRRWDVRFAGNKEQSIETFLMRVEECRRLAGLSENELLSALPELFTGVAAIWYRNNSNSWRSWREFCALAKRWYGTNRRFQQRLAMEAARRSQHPRESVSHYLTCLIAIMRKQEPPPCVKQQINLLYRNLLPSIQNQIHRDHVDSVERLLDLALEAELILETECSYQPPPSPENSLLPEMAFRPSASSSDDQPRLQSSNNSVPQVAATCNGVTEDVVTRLFDEKTKLLEQELTSPLPAKQQQLEGENTGNFPENNQQESSNKQENEFFQTNSRLSQCFDVQRKPRWKRWQKRVRSLSIESQ